MWVFVVVHVCVCVCVCLCLSVCLSVRDFQLMLTLKRINASSYIELPYFSFCNVSCDCYILKYSRKHIVVMQNSRIQHIYGTSVVSSFFFSSTFCPVKGQSKSYFVYF